MRAIKRGFGVVGSLAALVLSVTATSASGTYHQINVLAPPAIPGGFGLVSDIVFNDQDAHRVYLADDANAQVDVWDTRTNAFIGGICGSPGAPSNSCGTARGFTGETNFPNSFDSLGPAGVVLDDLGHVWAGNGNGAVKVASAATLRNIASIPTGSVLRADELAYDPIHKIIMVTNPSEANPFVTLINARTLTVITHISLGDGIPIDSIEQPQFDSWTGLFLVSVRQAFAGDANGEIAYVNPTTHAVATHALTVACNPAGMSLGPVVGHEDGGGDAARRGDDGHREAVLGCDSQPPVIINADNGTVLATFTQACCADEVWYNAGDGRYYVAAFGGSPQSVMVINAFTRHFVTTIPVSDPAFHAVAAGGNEENAKVFVPLGDGVHVFTRGQ